MQLDSVSSLECASKIVIDYLDPESQVQFSQVSKKIRTVIAERWLSDLKMDADKNPYLEVMNHYRDYCDYFRKTRPLIFSQDLFQEKGATVLRIKKVIDARLALPGSHPWISLIKELWIDFESWFPDGARKGFYPGGISYYVEFRAPFSDNNREAAILLAAGAEPKLLENFTETSWCTLKTVELLLDKGVKVTPKGIIAAIGRFDTLVDRMFKALAPDSYALLILLQELPSSHESYLSDYLDRLPSISAYKLRLALEKNRSEAFILYRNTFENWIYGFEKAPGSSD